MIETRIIAVRGMAEVKMGSMVEKGAKGKDLNP
jgi:hypothetical protein